MLYMFRMSFASIIRSTINCNSSHWCCHELGWNKSCIDVKIGAHCTVRTDLDIYTGFIPSQLMTTPVAAVTVYGAPDDGRKGHPKHVEHT